MNIPFKIIIPARYGSTRLPGKPLIMINGKTLIQHVYTQACASAAAAIVVATDDERIAQSAAAVGACVCITSHQHLSGSDRIAEVLETLNWPNDTCVVNIQGDEPCMPAALINQVAINLISHADAAIATLAVQLNSWNEIFDPNLVKVVTDAHGFALYFSRAPIPWHRTEFARFYSNSSQSFSSENEKASPPSGMLRHIGIYAYRAEFLRRYVRLPVAPIEMVEALEQLRALWHGERIFVDTARVIPGPGVDVASDIVKVEAWLAQQC